jgi:hypothetical protein
MSSNQDLLNRLLSGDFSPEEIAKDPVLISLAERIYGIKIDPVTVTKPRDFVSPTGVSEITEITEVAPPTDMLIEVIGLQRILFMGFTFVVLNLFGVWSYVFGSFCQVGDLCPTEGYTRLNLMGIYKLNTGNGWSEPVQNGAYGIPDIVAVVILGIALFTVWRK